MAGWEHIRFREQGDFREGAVLVVDKPERWTSFDVVNKIRSSLRGRCGKLKVGHAGTLDPLATGVMVLCTGKATKEIERYMGQEKEYVARVTFGHTTPSYDQESAFDGSYDYSRVDRALLEEVLGRFAGEIDQRPPAFSAVRLDGARAYEMARRGEEVEMKSRRVWIKEIEVVEMEMPGITLRVTCGKGTYIRSLAHDIGRACGSGSYLSALRRTRVGDFRVEEAFRLDELIRLLEEKRIE
ncbi:MAG: tRNA pseudouridine(55) synthase TruB [Odoribacteraceae bacterium]|jgi:tRNA pseudouridine55 synthase|nr:tRNA pseudouridine(55) synthase TruB [Odoribacteraceae bacterium]